MEKRKSKIVKRIALAFMALTMVVGLWQAPVSAEDVKNYDVELSGAVKSVTADPTVNNGYQYIAGMDVNESSAYKYLQFTYTGDITYLRLEFAGAGKVLWMNAADHASECLKLADDKMATLVATEPTTVVIDLAASGITDMSNVTVIHWHWGDALLAAGTKLNITDARLMADKTSLIKPVDPGVKPADPVVKPTDPVVKPATPAVQPKKDEFLLIGDSKGSSAMNGTYKLEGKKYTYMGWVTTEGATAAHNQLSFTYVGDITYLRLEFETAKNKSGVVTKAGPYWMTKDQATHFVSADGKDIPLKATKATTVVIDLVKSGIDISKYVGFHMHNGDELMAANTLKITDAKLINPTPERTQTISAKNISKAVGSKAFKLGAKLTAGTGTLSYTSSNKKVATIDKKSGKVSVKGIGTTKITITAAAVSGKYDKAVKTITLTVTPKKVTIASAKNTGKKVFTATWKKDRTVSGYQIRYTTDKKLKKNFKTAAKIKSNKTTKMTVKKLKKGKTYYVQVRAYKTVNGKAIYGNWSKTKAVKIRK